jgi:hypothetical protein
LPGEIGDGFPRYYSRRIAVRENAERRLKELRAEFQRGEEMLAGLQRQYDEVRNTMVRINGAIQILEEILSVEPVAEVHLNGVAVGQ